MTDLELTKLCAGAAGLNWADEEARRKRLDGAWRTHQETEYDPLRNDAQAMALVKRFRLGIQIVDGMNMLWGVTDFDDTEHANANADLNRAIVECVAKMQFTLVTPETIADVEME